MRKVLAGIALLLVGLAAGLLIGRRGGADPERPQARATPAPTRTATPTPTPRPLSRARAAEVQAIARRVETLRALRFRALPVPEQVSGAHAKREGLEDLDRSYPAARRHGDEEVLKLLGLIEPGVDLRDVSASVFGQGVAGYYDPRSKRLRIVSGAATGSRALRDVVLAHELTHALEDQRYGLVAKAGGTDDRAIALLSLIEGTATVVMQDYLLRYVSLDEALGGILGSLLAEQPALPPFLQDQLLFPYTGGMAFVQDLKRRAGGRWTLVDLADRQRPPASTEQVLHPDAWVKVESPLPVTLAPALGAGWRRTVAGTWGELRTRELLSRGGAGDAETAAAGWGGDRYELWQRSQANGCAAPCRAHDVLVMRWRWDTAADAREFGAALRRFAARRKGARVVARGDTVTLALAPTAELARRAAAA